MSSVTRTGEAILPLRLGPPLPKEEYQEGKPPDWLHVTNCPEKRCLEDWYEICEEVKWTNGRPMWQDGQNHIYMTNTKSWAIAVDEEGIHNNRGWLYDSAGAGDKKWPNQARSWHVYDGQNWNPCGARISSCPPPHMNVECDELPHLNGCYDLISADDADFPMWGHGSKRLYLDSVAHRWAVCVNPATMEETGGALCSSTEEPPRDRPDEVQDFVYFNGSKWVESSAAVWRCARPPPNRLTVACPEKRELNGTYKICKEELNGKHVWSDGDNFVYFTSNKAWAVCISKHSMENDQGWLYAKSRESKFPDKVTEWHAYDGKDWNASPGSSVSVPFADRRVAHTSPVHGQKPPRKTKAPKAKAASKAMAAVPKTRLGEAILPLRLGRSLPKEEVDHEGKPPDWLHVTNCPEKKCLEDWYEICEEGKWTNGRPMWYDGQNHIYMTSTKSWAIALDKDGMSNNRGWLYDSTGAGDEKWPNQAKSWHVYDGKDWKPCEAQVSSCPPPHMNVECDELPQLNGCYDLISADDEDCPMWGHGSKRLYQDSVAHRWAVCVNAATMEEAGGALCSSTQEPPRDMPDEVQDFVYFDGNEWVESSAAVWRCARPPPNRLTVACPEKRELNGTYKLCKGEINDTHAWIDGDNFIYFTKNKAWAVCIGKSSTEKDQGWLYAKSRESKFPDKVTEWHAYDGKDWNASPGSSVAVPVADRRIAHSSPVHGQKPPKKTKAPRDKAAPKAMAAAPQNSTTPHGGYPAASKPTSAQPKASKKKGLGRMGGDEAELSAARKKGEAKQTAAVSIMPNTPWLDIEPTRSCLEEIRGLAKSIRKSEDIADDVEVKIQELKFSAKDKVKEFGLGDDELCALAAYTHDLQKPDGSCSGNLYFELNKALRMRGQDERKVMMESWGCFVHYMIKAMSRLPDWKGECYRGFTGKDEILKEYELGRPIQWGAFTSVSTMWDVATSFSDPDDGVIFKIQITSGRQINDFSFFSEEGEILLTPAHRFIVSSDPYERDGFAVIDLVQQKNKVFVS